MLLGATVAALAGAALVGAALVPVLAPSTIVAEAARRVLHAVCHQEPSRSFFIDGHQLGVCHRCIGIYVGLFFGALAAAGGLRASPGSRLGWALAAAPIAVHVALRYILPSTDLADVRVATGLWFGIYAGAAFAAALADVGRVRARPSRPGADETARTLSPLSPQHDRS